MEKTTISFSDMHKHGALLSDLFRARRESFVVQKKWDLPETDGMEFDQYDTPLSRWIAVHERGRILAGIRLTPTTARCGIYTYMIRDAQQGLLETIPSDLLWDKAPVDPRIWEASRVFVARDVPAADRLRVNVTLMEQMVQAAREEGAEQIVALCPKAWMRWMRRLGYQTEHLGPCLDIGGEDNQAIAMHLRPTN